MRAEVDHFDSLDLLQRVKGNKEMYFNIFYNFVSFLLKITKLNDMLTVRLQVQDFLLAGTQQSKNSQSISDNSAHEQEYELELLVSLINNGDLLTLREVNEIFIDFR